MRGVGVGVLGVGVPLGHLFDGPMDVARTICPGEAVRRDVRYGKRGGRQQDAKCVECRQHSGSPPTSSSVVTSKHCAPRGSALCEAGEYAFADGLTTAPPITFSAYCYGISAGVLGEFLRSVRLWNGDS